MLKRDNLPLNLFFLFTSLHYLTFFVLKAKGHYEEWGIA